MNKNLTINSSPNNNSQNIINYFPQENKNFTNYKIEHNPINNKDGQKGIFYIAPNKPKKYVISNSNQNTHQEIEFSCCFSNYVCSILHITIQKAINQ